jgi:hypothetical protein
MILVPVPKTQAGYAMGAMQWGVYARSAGIHMEQTGINDDAMIVAHEHGASVARAAKILKGNAVFETAKTGASA